MPSTEPSERNTRQAQLMAFVSITQIVLTVIIAPLATWALMRIVDHGERIARIEATRFTAEEARDLVKEVRESLAPALVEMRQSESDLQTRLGRIERAMDRVILIIEPNEMKKVQP
jgi:hypothetical protein